MEQATAPSPLLVPGRSTLTAMPILPLAAAPGQLRAPHETGNVMTQARYELRTSPNGVTATIHARGSAVLASPTINRGTAFTLAERETLGLTGLLPTGVSTLESQLRRVDAPLDVRDLRRREGDHLVLLAAPVDEVEVVEVAAGRARDEHPCPGHE